MNNTDHLISGISPLTYTVKGFRNTVLSRIKTNMNEYNIFGMPRSTYVLCINMHEYAQS